MSTTGDVPSTLEHQQTTAAKTAPLQGGGAPRPPLAPRLRLGMVVVYHEHLATDRAALVGNIHEDGRTCDLIVLCEGDGQQARQAWAQGWGVTRYRGVISCQEDDPKGTRHWRFQE